MTDQFVGEIRIVPFNFAPVGWAICQGQILAISQNTALFSLLGTFYGGDGKANFALPNFQDNVAVHMGQSPGLSPYSIGEIGGTTSVTLLDSQIPAHSHALNASSASGTTASPAGNVPAAAKGSGRGGVGFAIDLYAASGSGAATTLAPAQLAAAGGSDPHNNLQPSLGLNYIIALQGIFPSRS